MKNKTLSLPIIALLIVLIFGFGSFASSVAYAEGTATPTPPPSTPTPSPTPLPSTFSCANEQELVEFGATCTVSPDGRSITFVLDDLVTGATDRDSWIAEYEELFGQVIYYEYDISYTLESTEELDGHDSAGHFSGWADIFDYGMWDDDLIVAAGSSSAGNSFGCGSGIANNWSRWVFYEYTPWADIVYNGTVTFSFEPTPKCDCASEFQYDEASDWVASLTVQGDEPINEVLDVAEPVLFDAGEWYAIQVAAGEWLDDGTGDGRFDLEFLWYDGSTPSEWEDLLDSELAICTTHIGDYYIAYVQAENSELLLRVNDETLSFDDNTGYLGVNIFAATRDRELESCEYKFRTGDWQQYNTVDAKKENGALLGASLYLPSSGNLVAGGWYKLVTRDGPWGYWGTTHVGGYYNMDISLDGSTTWQSLDEWGWDAFEENGADCNVESDPLGHREVYFKVPDDATEVYYLRVGDTEKWSNNIGYMGWDLYELVNMGDSDSSGDVGSCDFSYNSAATYAVGAFDGDDEDGSYITQALTPGDLYAIVFYDTPAWQEASGGANLYDVAISEDDGDTWESILDFPGTLCYEQNGNELTVFLKAEYRVYKLRADSATFSDNTGSMEFDVFTASEGGSIDPWETCLDGLILHEIDPHKWIPVRAEGGTGIGANNVLVVGESYVLEILGGPWTSPEVSTYTASISSDGGETWVPINRVTASIETGVTCTEVDQIDRYWKVLFTPEQGESWFIRVNDSNGDFLDNGGNLAFRLYEVQGDGIPDLDGIPVLTDPAFENICTLVCIRPDGILEIPNWLEYGRCSFQQYIAWCPRHTAILNSLQRIISGREPFATIAEFREALEMISAEMDSYTWEDEQTPDSILTGASSEMIEQVDSMYATDSSSPWNGGPLINFSDFSVAPDNIAYMTTCQSALSDVVWEPIQQGVCFISYQARESMLGFALQLMLDILSVVLLIGGVAKIASFGSKL